MLTVGWPTNPRWMGAWAPPTDGHNQRLFANLQTSVGPCCDREILGFGRSRSAATEKRPSMIPSMETLPCNIYCTNMCVCIYIYIVRERIISADYRLEYIIYNMYVCLHLLILSLSPQRAWLQNHHEVSLVNLTPNVIPNIKSLVDLMPFILNFIAHLSGF